MSDNFYNSNNANAPGYITITTPGDITVTYPTQYYYKILAGNPGNIVFKMPSLLVPQAVPQGQPFIVENQDAVTVTVNDSGNNFLATINQYHRIVFYPDGSGGWAMWGEGVTPDSYGSIANTVMGPYASPKAVTVNYFKNPFGIELSFTEVLDTGFNVSIASLVTPLPSLLRPTTTKYFFIPAVDSAIFTLGHLEIYPNGFANFFPSLTGAGFSLGGTGFRAFNVSYIQ